jgi:Domain of unknown function (DUF1818)
MPTDSEKFIQSGLGWRIGWHPAAGEFVGLVGGENWAFELTAAEFEDFSRLLMQLVETMQQMESELMEEERIACEAQSDLLWLEVEGYPHAYSVRIILNSGRRCEGEWPPEVVLELVQAVEVIVNS